LSWVRDTFMRNTRKKALGTGIRNISRRSDKYYNSRLKCKTRPKTLALDILWYRVRQTRVFVFYCLSKVWIRNIIVARTSRETMSEKRVIKPLNVERILFHCQSRNRIDGLIARIREINIFTKSVQLDCSFNLYIN